MASVAPRSGRHTFDEFLTLVNEDQHADLLDGVIYLASPVSIEYNRLAGWLYALMRGFVEERGLGEVFFTKVAFRIGRRSGPEPDLAFVARRRLKKLAKGFVRGAPDLAVEIVSPDSVQRDYVIKRRVYEQAGVREYWIIDPGQQRASFLRLRRRKYQQVAIRGAVFESQVLPGFRLTVRWLWSKRRPSVYPVLSKLLSEE